MGIITHESIMLGQLGGIKWGLHALTLYSSPSALGTATDTSSSELEGQSRSRIPPPHAPIVSTVACSQASA